MNPAGGLVFVGIVLLFIGTFLAFDARVLIESTRPMDYVLAFALILMGAFLVGTFADVM